VTEVLTDDGAPTETRADGAVGTSSDARWLAACDLDQTLIYSRRAFRLPPGVPEPELRVAEVYQGVPAGFLTRRAGDLLARLAAQAVLVPVTTRTLEQYHRVDLGVRCRYAVAANGGHLLVDGRPDLGWERQIRRHLEQRSRPLTEIRRLAEDFADARWVRTLRVADDFFVYLVAEERAAIPDLAELTATVTDRGWTLSVQGRKVYLVPASLTKQAALAEVARRSGTDAVVAAGDSLLDASMLATADVAIRPAHGELHSTGWHVPQLRVTRSAGLLAGEQVVETLLTVTAAALPMVTAAAPPMVTAAALPTVTDAALPRL
jgi:hypothetical protein